MSDPITIVLLIVAVVFAVLFLVARANTHRAAQQLYERWLQQNEAVIRQDAVERSRSVTIGKVTEHVAPWLPVFPFNPKDARFIGSPVDMIIFDGCDDDNLQRIVFLEIKTSGSALSSRQRQIRDAVRDGRVEWQELRVPVHVA